MKAADKAKLGLGVIGAGIIGYGLYSMKKDTENILNAPRNFLDGLFGGESLGGSGLPGTETDANKSGSSTKRFLEDAVEYITKPEEIVKAKNVEIYSENPDPTTRTQYGTAGPLSGFTDLVTKGPIGILGNVIADIGSSINPMPDDLKATQTKYASGNFGVEDSAGQDSLYRKLFIKESKTDNFQMGTNVAEIKTHQQAVSLGLGLAPLAVNTQSDFKKSSDIYFPVLEASPATKYTEKTKASTGTKYTEKTSSGSSSSSYTDSTGRVYTPTSVIKAKW